MGTAMKQEMKLRISRRYHKKGWKRVFPSRFLPVFRTPVENGWSCETPRDLCFLHPIFYHFFQQSQPEFNSKILEVSLLLKYVRAQYTDGGRWEEMPFWRPGSESSFGRLHQLHFLGDDLRFSYYSQIQPISTSLIAPYFCCDMYRGNHIYLTWAVNRGRTLPPNLLTPRPNEVPIFRLWALSAGEMTD